MPVAAGLVVWLPRLVVLAYVGRWLIPTTTPAQPDWLSAALAGLAAANWVVLESAAGRPAEAGWNRSAQVVGGVGVAVALAGGVCLYAGSLKLLEGATMASAALVGAAVVGTVAGAGCRGALAAPALLLPAMAVIPATSGSSAVPPAAYWLVATAPLAFAPWLLPPLGRRAGWVGFVLRYAAPAGVVIAALVLAGQVESLPWEDAPPE